MAECLTVMTCDGHGLFIMYLLQPLPANMMYTCLEAVVQMRDVWRSSTMENGALFVMIIGT